MSIANQQTINSDYVSSDLIPDITLTRNLGDIDHWYANTYSNNIFASDVQLSNLLFGNDYVFLASGPTGNRVIQIDDPATPNASMVFTRGPQTIYDKLFGTSTNLTRKVALDPSSKTNSTTSTLLFSGGNQSITFPANNITLVDLSSTQTLASKTLTSPIIGTISGACNVTGALTSDTEKSDYSVFFGLDHCNYDAGSLVRNTAGDWLLLLPTNSTVHCAWTLSEPIRIAANKGFKLSSVSLSYIVNSAALSSATANIIQVSQSDVTAITTAGITTSGTLATATNTSTQTYLKPITVSSPAYLNPAAGNSWYVYDATLPR